MLDHDSARSTPERLQAGRWLLDRPPPRSALPTRRLGALRPILVATVLVAMLAASTALTRAHGQRAGRVRPGAHPAAAHRDAAASQAGLLGRSQPESLPFPRDPRDRAPRPGEVPSLYADGLACSTGCRPQAAETGWPLAPFHQQHPLRAGLNELRPGSLHVGLDIQAVDRAPVYAVQPGIARVLAPSGPDARVRVGSYIYWHITPLVRDGQAVTPFKTVLGTVMPAYGHIAFSELDPAGDYVNPLRPGGTVLAPYANSAAPVIGQAALERGGQVIVPAYSPQTFVRWTTYVTPVLAPAAIAYRLYETDGRPVTPLEWAFRGTHLLPWVERSLIYAPGAHAPGFACFATRSVCVPRWVYRVAGGLTPPLPRALAPGRYRLSIYSWDWSDYKTALDTTVTMTANGWRPVGRFPNVLLRLPDYFSRAELLAPAWRPVWRTGLRDRDTLGGVSVEGGCRISRYCERGGDRFSAPGRAGPPLVGSERSRVWRR